MKPERGNAIFTLHLERVKARTLSPVALPRNHLNCSLMSTRDKASEKRHGPATDQRQQDIKPAWKRMNIIIFYYLKIIHFYNIWHIHYNACITYTYIILYTIYYNIKSIHIYHGSACLRTMHMSEETRRGTGSRKFL